MTGTLASSSRLRRILWPGIMTASVIAIGISLGVWQIHRLAWKRALLAQIDHAQQSAPIPLHGKPGPFDKIIVSGRYLPAPVALYGAEVRQTPFGGWMGADEIAALQPDQGPPILVNRGWVPTEGHTPPPLPTGRVDVVGFARPGDTPGWLSAHDDLARRRVYTLDPARIGPAMGLSKVAPFVVIALGKDQMGVYPQPATSLPQPPNNHLQYALTWYGLAGVLLIMFGSYVWKTMRP